MAPVSQFEAKPAPGDMVGSVKFAPNSSSRIIASCWDARVYLYEIQGQGEEAHASLVREFPHKAAVLDVCFGKDDDEAFSTDLNKQINRIDLATGEQIVIGHHEKPAPRIAYSREHSILISASWDGSIQFYNANDFNQAPIKAQLPGKAQALAASPSKVVVAMNARLVHIYDLPTVASILNGKSASELTPWQQRESSLKFLTRAVACMPNDAGYATSSIEGRVAVEWFEDSAESQARKYAFKCHRQTAPEEEGGGDIVFPVNALAFHPRYGTFASGGGDGTVALWDAEAKRRMKVYQKIPNSVWALAFSNDGKYLAMSVAPGFETGQEDYSGEGQSQILIRELGETEARGKGAK